MQQGEAGIPARRGRIEDSWEEYALEHHHVEFDAASRSLLIRIKSLQAQAAVVDLLRGVPLPVSVTEVAITGGLRGADHCPSQLVDAVMAAVASRNRACVADSSIPG